MAKYSPNEFLYARPLANAILNDVSFSQWFLARTKFADMAGAALPLPEPQAALRTTARSRKWFWFNYFCPTDSHCFAPLKSSASRLERYSCRYRVNPISVELRLASHLVLEAGRNR